MHKVIYRKIRVTCPFCSLHCTDLRLSFDENRLEDFSPACAVGEAGFRHAIISHSNEQTAKFFDEKTLRTTRGLLLEANQLMVVLSGNLDNETISAAVRLARQYSAILVCEEDNTGSMFGLAIQAAGLLTCTLGELNDLSMIILYGLNPALSYPRLSEFLGGNHTTRTLHLAPLDQLEDLRWLRFANSDPRVGIPDMYAEYITHIETASSGFIVFGSDWVKKGLPYTTELLLWLKELNRKKHWYGLYLPPGTNSKGIVDVLLSETGYPGNMRFTPNGIEYSPRLWRADRIIQQGVSDLCLLVGQPHSISEETSNELTHIRTILIDPEEPEWKPRIFLPSTLAGVDSPGWVQRLDGVPVDLNPILPSRRPSIKDLLRALTYEDLLI